MVKAYNVSLNAQSAKMTPAEIRQKLHHQIDRLPSDLLGLVSDFLELLTFKLSRTTEVAAPTVQQPIAEIDTPEPVLNGSIGAELLQFAGTWRGDDFEECLQTVYETRSPAEFQLSYPVKMAHQSG